MREFTLFLFVPLFSMFITNAKFEILNENFGTAAHFIDILTNNNEVINKDGSKYNIGHLSAVCWSKIVTLVENINGQVLQEKTEYATTFKTPKNIPSDFMLNNVGNEIIKSNEPPIVTISQQGENVVKENKYTKCSYGPLYKEILAQYEDKKRSFEIRINIEAKSVAIASDINAGRPSLKILQPDFDEAMDLLNKAKNINSDSLLTEFVDQLLAKGAPDSVQCVAATKENFWDLLQNLKTIFNISDSILENIIKKYFSYYYNIEDPDMLEQFLKDDLLKSLLRDYLSDHKVHLYDNDEKIEEIVKDPSLKELIDNYIKEHYPTLLEDLIRENIKAANSYLAKHRDTNGNIVCFRVYEDHMDNEHCPENVDNLPLAPITSLPYIGKVGNSNTGYRCISMSPSTVTDIECPANMDEIPVISNDINYGKSVPQPVYKPVDDSYLAKHRDANGNIICYRVYKTHMINAVCPLNTDNLPLAPVSKFGYDARVGNPQTGYRCVRISASGINDINCPPDMDKLPILSNNINYGKAVPVYKPVDASYLAKHRDANGNIVCYRVHKTHMTNAVCPINTDNLPLAPVSKFGHDARVGNPQTGYRCLRVSVSGVNDIDCPPDLDKLPVLSNDINYGKPVPTPAYVPVDDSYLAKHRDTNGNIVCYRVYKTHITNAVCPLNTDNLPLAPVSKFGYDAKVGNPQTGYRCVRVTPTAVSDIECPANIDQLPTLSNDINYGKVLPTPVDEPYLTKQRDADVKPTYAPVDDSYLAKHQDANGNIVCYRVHNTHMTNAVCPINTDNLPLAPVSKFSYDARVGNPQTGYRCLRVSVSGVNDIDCPPDMDNLPVLSNDINYGKPVPTPAYVPVDDSYLVQQGDAEVKPTYVPLDDAFLAKLNDAIGKQVSTPVYVPVDDSYLAKHRDANGNIVCYRVYKTQMANAVCPLNTDNLPLAPVSKFGYDARVGNPQTGYRCVRVTASAVNDIDCPPNMDQLPVFSNDINYGKSMSKPAYVPADDSYLAKHRDANGNIVCYRVYKTHMKNVDCPLNTDNLPLAPVSKFGYDAKAGNPTGGYKCFRISQSAVITIDCPANMDQIPLISNDINYGISVPQPVYKPVDDSYLAKHRDANGNIVCYRVYKTHMTNAVCPLNTDNLPLAPVSNFGYDARVGNPQTGYRCVRVSASGVNDIDCPSDIDKLPVLSNDINYGKAVPTPVYKPVDASYFGKQKDTSLRPISTPTYVPSDGPYLAKYRDAIGNINCYRVYKMRMTHTVCPLNTDSLPLAPISKLSYDARVGNPQTGYRCVRVSPSAIKDIDCPPDLDKLPVLSNDINYGKPVPTPAYVPVDDSYLAKHRDANGNIVCYRVYKTHITNAVCPLNTDNLPLAPVSKFGYDAKVGNPQTGYRCVRVTPTAVNDIECPANIDQLPTLSNDINYGKALPTPVDDSYLTKQRDADVKPTNAPVDDSYLAKHRDANGNIVCYRVYKTHMTNAVCPINTDNLPLAPVSKFSYDARVGNPQPGYRCVRVSVSGVNDIDCPADIDKLPVLSNDINYGKAVPTPVYKPVDASYLGKQRDANGNIVCYRVYKTHMKNAVCPLNTDNLPLAPVSKFGYDAKVGNPQTGYRCVRVTPLTLNDINCPPDMEKLPVLSNDINYGRAVPTSMYKTLKDLYFGKQRDANVRPVSTPTYVPVDDFYLAKHRDANGNIVCYRVYKTHMTNAVCPLNTDNLPLAPVSKFGYDARVGNPQTGYRCVKVTLLAVNDIECPPNMDKLPVLSNDINYGKAVPTPVYKPFDASYFEKQIDSFVRPVSTPIYVPVDDSYLAKHRDANGNIVCYKVYKTHMTNAVCPLNTDKLPLAPVSEFGYDAKVGNPQTGYRCVRVTTSAVNDIDCPSNVEQLPTLSNDINYGKPESYLAKHRDVNGNIVCFNVFKDHLESAYCPPVTDNLPWAPVSDLDYVGKIGDDKNGYKCLLISESVTKDIPCPPNTDILPFVDDATSLIPTTTEMFGKDISKLGRIICKFRAKDY